MLRALVGALLAALVAVVPPIPHPQRERIELQREMIVSMATASSARYRVPPSVLLVVAFMETHLGTDDGEGGGWGAPIDARHPDKAGTSDHAARILARGRKVCGSWQGAVSWFRSGRCRPPPFAERYVRRGMQLIERMHSRANVPVPKDLYADGAGQLRPEAAPGASAGGAALDGMLATTAVHVGKRSAPGMSSSANAMSRRGL